MQIATTNLCAKESSDVKSDRCLPAKVHLIMQPIRYKSASQSLTVNA